MNHLNAQHMRQFVERNQDLVRSLSLGNGLTLLKYKNKVFYKNLWTPEMCELRGTIVDENFNIVQRPFTKIFNYGERKTRIGRDEMVIAPRKINGFMAAASIYNGELLVSTTGSTTSDFADLARKWLEPQADCFEDDMTYIFEICDSSDPHVIPENLGAWLLGARYKEWDTSNHDYSEAILDLIAHERGWMRPEWQSIRFSDLVKLNQKVDHEGFVCWTEDGQELKLKSPYYLATKFLGRKKESRLDEILSNPESVKEIIDEEFYGIVDHLADMKDEFIAMSEQDRFAYVRQWFDTEVI